jgi:hypothetical protein
MAVIPSRNLKYAQQLPATIQTMMCNGARSTMSSCADVLVFLAQLRHSGWREAPRWTMEPLNLELSHAFQGRTVSYCSTEGGQNDCEVFSRDVWGR